ncbi:MAG: hypothetical protein Q4D93_04745 [Porphyromonas sp.]|nr:hypothetical protein [Porphyromonas sp.]
MESNSLTPKGVIQEIIAEARALGKAKVELLRLKLVEEGAPKVGQGVFFFVFFCLAIFSLLFLLISGATALALPFAHNPVVVEAIRALALGFLVAFFIVAAILFILLVRKKAITKGLENKFATSILDAIELKEEEEDESELLSRGNEVFLDDISGE